MFSSAPRTNQPVPCMMLPGPPTVGLRGAWPTGPWWRTLTGHVGSKSHWLANHPSPRACPQYWRSAHVTLGTNRGLKKKPLLPLLSTSAWYWFALKGPTRRFFPQPLALYIDCAQLMDWLSLSLSLCTDTESVQCCLQECLSYVSKWRDQNHIVAKTTWYLACWFHMVSSLVRDTKNMALTPKQNHQFINA